MRSLLLLIALSSSVAFGATLEMEALDYSDCLRWHMTSDTGGSESESYKIALEVARRHHNFLVFSASSTTRSGKVIEKFGACTYEQDPSKSKFYCISNQDYPFAGATFMSKGYAPLRCISGCSKVTPALIVQDFASDEEFSKSKSFRASKFRRVCKAR